MGGFEELIEEEEKHEGSVGVAKAETESPSVLVVGALKNSILEANAAMKVPVLMACGKRTMRLYMIDCILRSKGTILRSVDESMLVRMLLSRNKYRQAFKLAKEGIFEPETWLTSTLYLLNFFLRNGNVLYKRYVSVESFIELYRRCREREEYEYFQHTVDYCFLKLGIKYMTMGFEEEAYKVAFEIKSSYLNNIIRVFCRSKRNYAMLSFL